MSAILLLTTIGTALVLLAALLPDRREGDDSTRGRRRFRPAPVPVETARQSVDHER